MSKQPATADGSKADLEITAEMIEAGADTIMTEADWNYLRLNALDLAERVIRDALAQAPRRPPGKHAS